MFTGADGRQIPAFVYPPRNPDFAGPDDAAPPLPRLRARRADRQGRADVLDRDVAYFTSRGFGLRRGELRRLRRVTAGSSASRSTSQWGVVDVNDCATVAAALAEEGSADGARPGHPRRQRGRLDLGGVDDHGGHLPVRDDHVPDPGPGRLDVRRRDARLRVPLHRSARRRAARARGPLRRSLADQPHRPARRPGAAAAGPGGRGVPARAGGPVRREPRRQRRAARVPDVRGRAARVPPRGDDRDAALEAELSFYGQVFGFDAARACRSWSCARERPDAAAAAAAGDTVALVAPSGPPPTRAASTAASPCCRSWGLGSGRQARARPPPGPALPRRPGRAPRGRPAAGVVRPGRSTR